MAIRHSRFRHCSYDRPRSIARFEPVSQMPSIGTSVTLVDGREAVVSNVSPLGGNDRVRFPDGHEECIMADDIYEIGPEDDE